MKANPLPRPMPQTDVVLVTGFEPFGGEAHNSSEQLARALDGCRVGAWQVRSAGLPTRFGATGPALESLLAPRPGERLRAVVALGQAASRTALSFERVAVNWADARIPDNDGAQPVDVPVLAGAPAACFTTLPIKRMVDAARSAGVPAEVSYTAGSFVCNQVFFLLQHRLRRRRGVASGFVHVPSLPGPLTLEAMRAGMRAALAGLADPGGAGPAGSEGRLD